MRSSMRSGVISLSRMCSAWSRMWASRDSEVRVNTSSRTVGWANARATKVPRVARTRGTSRFGLPRWVGLFTTRDPLP